MAEHVHEIELQRGVWTCTTCPAAWQRCHMIPAGSVLICARFTVPF